ncbi:hypothetical protein AAD018_009935 [Aestuariibius insulae]
MNKPEKLERLAQLEKVLCDYIERFGATEAAMKYFINVESADTCK